MKSNTVFAHDKQFRQSMHNPIIAQNFFENYLPDWAKNEIELGKLELQPDTFLSATAKAYYTDLLYKVPIHGKEGFLFLLVEHKSYPERFLPLQIMEYMTQIWRKYVTTHSKAKTLPIIYPVTFYHGKQSPYPYSTRLTDLFDNREMAEKIWSQTCQLIDMTMIPDEEIKTHQHTALFELIFKHIFDRDIAPIIADIIESGILTKTYQSHRDFVIAMLKYVMGTGNSTADSKQLVNTLIQASMALP